MKRIILFLLLVAAPPMVVSNPWVETRYPRKDVTLDGLYEACDVVGKTTRGDIQNFDCESYVYGVLDAYLSVRSSIPKEKRACFPATLAPWEALRDGWPAIEDPQIDSSKTAGPILIEMLRRKYPCK